MVRLVKGKETIDVGSAKAMQMLFHLLDQKHIDFNTVIGIANIDTTATDCALDTVFLKRA